MVVVAAAVVWWCYGGVGSSGGGGCGGGAGVVVVVVWWWWFGVTRPWQRVKQTGTYEAAPDHNPITISLSSSSSSFLKQKKLQQDVRCF